MTAPLGLRTHSAGFLWLRQYPFGEIQSFLGFGKLLAQPAHLDLELFDSRFEHILASAVASAQALSP